MVVFPYRFPDWAENMQDNSTTIALMLSEEFGIGVTVVGCGELMGIGVAFPAVAFLSALGHKSYWHMSQDTLGTKSVVMNQWLPEQGFVSIKKLWCVIHYPATAR